MLFLPGSTDLLRGTAAKWPSILLPFTFPDRMPTLLDGGPPNPTGKKLSLLPFCTTDGGNRNRPGITGARDADIMHSHINGVVRFHASAKGLKKYTHQKGVCTFSDACDEPT